MWGSDLSGSQQGAGGVGGLLEISYNGSSTTNCFPAFDGNGNVAALINAADGTVTANYEYGPFGEVIRSTGLMAKNNPFRFSTKYDDDESDLLYYGYRCYKPSTGTWPNHDPLGELGFGVLIAGLQPYLASGGMSDDNIERMNRLSNEPGGPNLYGFCANAPVTKIDRLGLDYSWGSPGGFPSSPGAYGPFYNPEPDWYKHPADEGKPCCCKDGPAKLSVKRTDNAGIFRIIMKIDLQMTGCYKDLIVVWDTCWRYDDSPWGSQSAGAIADCVNSTSCGFNAYGDVYRTDAHIRYLSCEGGKWALKTAHAPLGYSRSFPGMPW
jgi:RHS repeat-associated protein